MSCLNEVGRKKRKRGEKVFRFKNFGENGYPSEFLGPFRENVKTLLEFGNWESNNFCSGFQSWSFQLEVHRHPPFHILLLVIEEPVEASPMRHCKHCQYVGWGHHMICNKKYHFLLPSKDTMMAACSNCKTNSNGLAFENNNLATKPFSFVELQGHILHGVFHSNGFGHLLCVNGLETGSDLPGYLAMEFWDRLCNGLRARKVSLNDISQKRGMELRLIHGASYSHSWFGRWGYKFGRGSFSVTQQMYQKALEAIQSTPLSLLLHHLPSNSNHELSLIFSKYQSLSDHSLLNLGDLFHFMCDLKSRLQTQTSLDSHNLSGFLVETSCRWSPKRVEMAVRVIIEALKRAEFRWVSRQEVRDAARMYIGDTGLLDFVLKSLGNHVVGNYLVRRTLNPVTKVLEYCLQDVCNVFNNPKTKPRQKVGRAEVNKDIFNLYRYVLRSEMKGLSGKGILSALTMASGIVLDSKFLVKEYTGEPPSMGIEGKLNLFCTVRFKGQEVVDSATAEMNVKTMVAPPYECVVLKNNATFDELKAEVERNFRDIYWGLRSFGVESIANLNAKGSDLVFGLVEVGRKLVFEGNCNGRIIMENNNNYNNVYENGEINWIVDCVCGAREDDGERMVTCDICEVWQHTRCVQIPNDQQIPHIFLCNRCEQEISLLPSLP